MESRYQRQISLEEVGEDGQLKLKKARVLIVGLGGLGSPVALYLAASGIGHIGIIDGDTVSESNLHRQILYSEKDIGRPKVPIARARLEELNSETKILSYETFLNEDNFRKIISDYDLVIDATDSFASRYLVNESCFSEKKPFVFASLEKFSAQAALFFAEKGPCLRCLFPSPPPPGAFPSCNAAGVLGPLAGIMGSYQALLALRYLLGLENRFDKIWRFDAKSLVWREYRTTKDPNCTLCHNLKKENSMSLSISPSELKEQLHSYVLIDVREDNERAICKLNSLWIPLGELSSRFSELNADKNHVVYCHHGVRSLSAAMFLEEKGYKVKSLSGGIDRWATEVEPEMPRY